MGQRFTFVTVKKNDITSFRLTLAKLQTQTDPVHFGGDLASLQRVPGPPPPELFFRKAFDNCERLIRTPSRVSISARSRAIVQLVLSATGSSSNGVTTRNATVLFTGSGPGAMRAFNASAPPLAKSPRQRRTVSSRTPNASAMRGLVQPESVNRTARALSASPRSRDVARTDRAACSSPLAVTGDFPLMPHLSESVPEANRTAIRWSTYRNLLSPVPLARPPPAAPRPESHCGTASDPATRCACSRAPPPPNPRSPRQSRPRTTTPARD